MGSYVIMNVDNIADHVQQSVEQVSAADLAILLRVIAVLLMVLVLVIINVYLHKPARIQEVN